MDTVYIFRLVSDTDHRTVSLLFVFNARNANKARSAAFSTILDSEWSISELLEPIKFKYDYSSAINPRIQLHKIDNCESCPLYRLYNNQEYCLLPDNMLFPYIAYDDETLFISITDAVISKCKIINYIRDNT